ncbi:MAG TPA: sodium:proton antiporter [Nocardioidaceae bacterium]|nr:sodium:proton antiporter [Nocardioidaceae bacterium]
MIVVNYLAALLVFCLGLYVVITQRNIVKMVMGLSLMETSTYVLALSLAYRAGSTAPILLHPPAGKSEQDIAHGNVADPVLQNICLTAIVIGVAVTAVLLATAVRLAQHYRSVDADRIRQLRG